MKQPPDRAAEPGPAPAPRPSAVALSYRPGEHAPKVVAKGYGLMAERIVARAREANVFVHDAPELVNLLMALDLDAHIPETLYRAVAEVLAFVHFLEQRAAGAPAAPPQAVPAAPAVRIAPRR